MKQRFYRTDMEIMIKAHGLHVSCDCNDWDCESGRSWSYTAIPTYCGGERAPFTLVHKEEITEDGLVVDEYLFNDAFSSEG